MSENQKSTLCLFVTLTFFLTGLTGIGMAVYVSVYGYEDVSHSAAVETTETIVRYVNGYN